MKTLDYLPCTAPELAAQMGITLRLANARLQDYARRGLAQRTDAAVVPLQKRKGRHPHLWVSVIAADAVIAAEPLN